MDTLQCTYDAQRLKLTQAPCRDVGGDEDGGPSALELAQHPVPLLLPLVTVDAAGGVPGDIWHRPLNISVTSNFLRSP